MRDTRLFALGLITAAALTLLTGLSPAAAQTTAAAPEIKPLTPQLKCNPQPLLPTAGAFSDPFKGALAEAGKLDGVIPVSDQDKSTILNSDLPCQERVSPVGPENVGLENLQRGFAVLGRRCD